MSKLIRRPKSGRPDLLYLSLVPLCLALFAQPGFAQGADDEEAAIDEIVTTGSLIKREQSSNLVVTLTTDDFIDRGATNPVEILDTITSIQALDVTSNVLNLFNPSFANFANLRSLGGQSTLTLLDGKRVVRDPFAGIAVNLNALPQTAISSVDILADGASAIYGSDAIAGVINFRMYEEYDGIGLTAVTTQPTEGDGGDLNKVDLIFGSGSLDDDGHNFYFSASYRERDDLRPADRDYTEGPWGGVLHGVSEPGGGPNFGTRLESFPGNARQRNNPNATGPITTATGANPYPDCPVLTDQLEERDIASNGNGACVYTMTGLDFIIMSEEVQRTIATQYSKRIAGDHTVSLQFFQAWSDITRERPWNRRQGDQIPLESPFYPGNGIVPAIAGQDLTSPVELFGASMVFLERPTQTVSNETWRLLASLDGTVGAVDYEVWALRSEAEFESAGISYNNAWRDGLTGAEGAPYLNPWADFAGQTPEGQAFINENYAGKVRDRVADSSMDNFGFTLAFDINALDIGAGPTTMAFAGEYTEEFLFTGRPLERAAINGQTPAQITANNVTGSRDLYSATVEFLVPILDNLELSAAIRYDDYSDVGDTTNPKFLLNWDALPNLNLHASYSTGFRAPTLVQLFQDVQIGGTIPASPDIFDAELCPDGVTPLDPRDDPFNVCDLRVNRIQGGNLGLQPEESETYAIGAEISFPDTAVGNLAFAIDYWNYEIEDVINSGIPPEAIFEDLDTFGNFLFRCSTFSEEVIVDELNNCPDDPADRFNDYIGAVLQTNANIGTTQTSGFDFKILWDLPTDIGDWSFSYNATYVSEYEQERYKGDGLQSRLGQFLTRNFGPVLEFKHFATLNWMRGNWSAMLQHQYQSDYEDCGEICRRPERTVEDYDVFNIGAGYRFNDSIRVSLRVQNVFQNDPPFTNNTGSGSITTVNTDVRYFDHIGRRVNLNLVANF